MKYYTILAMSGLLLTLSGCAENQAASSSTSSHYATRTKRLGSNIPQPYDASADRGDDPTNQANAAALQRVGNTNGSMGNGGH